MLLFAVVWAGGYWINIALYTRSFDKPLRALLAISVLLLIFYLVRGGCVYWCYFRRRYRPLR